MPQTFLTAQWRKLLMANYIVDPAVLLPYVPAHTELDLFGGKCFLSLVGFMFMDTRLLGFRVPMHVDFEEVNLRFYVHHTGAGVQRKRGVVFIRELVPRFALSFVANTFYGEHYETLPMRHKWHRSKAGLVVSYRWNKGGNWHKLQAVASPESAPIAAGSEEELITEHYWGYTKLRSGRTSEYEVVHPRWDVYHVHRYSVDVDFMKLYGPDFALLDGMQPASVLLAEGSGVTVRSGARIRLRS
jgi:uncharacterized protein YqjF (DUF2071 family)